MRPNNQAKHTNAIKENNINQKKRTHGNNKTRQKQEKVTMIIELVKSTVSLFPIATQ
jgi:hypothetical protein